MSFQSNNPKAVAKAEKDFHSMMMWALSTPVEDVDSSDVATMEVVLRDYIQRKLDNGHFDTPTEVVIEQPVVPVTPAPTPTAKVERTPSTKPKHSRWPHLRLWHRTNETRIAAQ